MRDSISAVGDSVGDIGRSVDLKLGQLSQEVKMAAEKAGAAVDRARADLAGKGFGHKTSAASRELRRYMPHTSVADPAALMPHHFLVRFADYHPNVR